MTNDPGVPLVYIDANPFIYAIEGGDDLAAPIKDLFSLFRSRRGIAVTSELTLAEVLTKAPTPLHRRSYLDLLVWSQVFELRPVTRDILIETADYRRVAATPLSDGRQTMPKLPDAIHVVTAIRAGCRKILSTDGRLKLPIEIDWVEADSVGIAKLTQELT